MHTRINLGNTLGYSFYPSKVYLYRGNQEQQPPSNREEDPELSSLLNDFFNTQTSTTGWASLDQQKSQELYLALVSNAFEGTENHFEDAKIPVSFEDGTKGTIVAISCAPEL